MKNVFKAGIQSKTYRGGSSRCFLFWRSGGGVRGRCLGIGVDLKELSADLDYIALLREVLRDHAVMLRQNIDDNFVSFDPRDDLVSLHILSNVYTHTSPQQRGHHHLPLTHFHHLLLT